MRDLKVIAVLLGVLTLFAIGVVLRELQTVLLPFVIAVFLSLIFKPVVLVLTRRRVPMAVALVVVVALIAGLLFGVSMIITASVESFIATLPRYQSRLDGLITSLAGTAEALITQLGYRTDDLRITDALSASSITSVVSASLGTILGLVSDAFMVLLFMIFILAGSGQLSRKIEGAFQDEHARSMASIIAKIDQKVRQYLVTKTLVSVGTGGLSALILWIIGVDFPLLWGFITFLFNYIPNFGSLLATLFPVILALVQFDTPTPALVALVLLVVMQNLMGNILEPRLMAFSLNLSPVLVLVSLIFWGWLWGVVGMILAVPIMSMIKIVFEHIDALKPVAALMSSGDVRA